MGFSEPVSGLIVSTFLELLNDGNGIQITENMLLIQDRVYILILLQTLKTQSSIQQPSVKLQREPPMSAP